MKKIVLALIAACMTSGPAYGFEENVPTNISPLDYACRTLEIDCTGIKMPIVVYTDIMGAMGLHGAYMPGDNMVFIDPDAPAHTLVHEVTHYMLYESGFRMGRCTSEEAARRVHHSWEGTPYSDLWRGRYGC